MTDKMTILISDDDDVTNEKQFINLNERGFVRGASALDQWYILVNDAWKMTRLPANDLVRDYLVVMLNRFSTRVDLFETLSAFEYCEYVLGVRKIDSPCVQDIADIGLQYVAFFPERSKYRHEPRTLRYSAEVAIGLYNNLARHTAGKDDWYSSAYQSMARSFGQAIMVLRSTCERFIHNERVHEALTDAEAKRVAQLAVRFDQMYCEQSLSSSSIN